MVRFVLKGKPYQTVVNGPQITLVAEGQEIDITGQRIENFRATPCWVELKEEKPKTIKPKKAKGGKKK